MAGTPRSVKIVRKKVYQDGYEKWVTVGRMTLFADMPDKVFNAIVDGGINVDMFEGVDTYRVFKYDEKGKDGEVAS